ncbi:uncharacterized protein I303_103725 [Kwoniella dejecticola CBS 10117]|uniref:Mitochondrial transcription factor 1 n=1 Tax=Kwoniella dejecticola CBS 10117 TaxID=1296121 RepID=A0A1A6A7J2_9TREE|nr:uncharacterized protein I303_03742 [Kwoniella dejecticola CBS 10117]OBR86025.1 hypothetical protein I303_03742 [Kwoniella dejecticola CBS 10117]
MSIINRIPPLPLAARWQKHFPAKLLPASPDRNMIRKSVGRKLLANQELCDRFVRSLKIRPDEVIIEGYAGVGALTRSLLSGGESSKDASGWSSTLLEEISLESQTQVASKSRSKKGKYPSWLDDLPASSSMASSSTNPKAETEAEAQGDSSTSTKPKLVVASEGSIELLVRSFNYPPKADTLSASGKPAASDPYTREIPVLQTPLHPNLLLSHSTAYVWPTLPKILANPLVVEQLPVHDPTLIGAEATKRSWEDPEPPITLVCQMPDSSIGEQLAAQWIGSAVGDPGQKRTWIWEWGRIRLALLCGKSLYDRIMAPPASIVNCKLSILTQALFDIVPLPPFHHVVNVDKQSRFTEDRPSKPLSSVPISAETPLGIPSESSSSSNGLITQFEAGIPKNQNRTQTFPLDFFPPQTTSQRLIGKPLDRPDLLGLMLIPKLQSPILASQKDTWDYVMRRMFVRDTLTVRAALPNLNFGAETLITNIEKSNTNTNTDTNTGEDGEGFRGIPVNGERVIRDLTIPEWLRIVDVFDKWAFKPDNLILDSGNPDETSREVGQD